VGGQGRGSWPGRLLATTAVGVAVLAALLGAQPASAATATAPLVADVFVPDAAGFALPGGTPTTGGVSVAFDGRFLYFTSMENSTEEQGTILHRVSPCFTPGCIPGDELKLPIVGAPGISALSFDVTTNDFWAVDTSGDNIYLLQLVVDPLTGQPTMALATFQFSVAAAKPGDCDNGFGCNTLVDGIAFDAHQDPTTHDHSIWYSPDGSQRVYHYSTAGTLLGVFDVNDPPDDIQTSCSDEFAFNSGVAVGGDTPLWLTADGCGDLFEYGTTPTYLPPLVGNCVTPPSGVTPTSQYCPGSLIQSEALSSFAPGTSRAEDDECDSVTFAVNVLWVRDAFDGHFRAYQTPGSCIFGGGVPLLPNKSRMTGGGSFVETAPTPGEEIRHGFTLHCDAALGVQPNGLQINTDHMRFHLETITSSGCSDDPTINPNPPGASFDTIHIMGTGRYNGVPGAAIDATFTDAGEPGTADHAKVTITVDGSPVLVADSSLTHGDQQAHQG
jgi:hypothetical protein